MMNELKNTIEASTNVSVTENGAIGYATTYNKLVDLNFRVPSMRRDGLSHKDIGDFITSLEVDPVHTVKWLFFIRDVREGLGERKAFNQLFTILFTHDYDVAVECVKIIAEYGRWKDLVDLCENKNLSLCEFCLNEIETQLREDIKNYTEGKSISLLAKWLPSVNASKKARKMARVVAKKLEIPFVTYRKTLSKLRAYLDVTEVKTCSNRWDEIDYNKVSSNANLKYANAFMKHDSQRRLEYLTALKSGNPSAKMNASVLYPHEIWAKYKSLWSEDDAYEAMWNNLKDMGDCGNTLCVVDVSGSMYWTDLGGFCAGDVAQSIGTYFAERCSGEYKNKMILFSSSPRYIDISGLSTLRDKMALVNSYNDCSNTNIERTFDVILETAVNNNIPQEELPKNILIISDMEFDSAVGYTVYCTRKDLTPLFETIKKKYEKAGYKLPRLVFWNVNSRTNTIPVTTNEYGVALVSGYSVNIVKMIMSGELDPWMALKSTLDSSRYDAITKVFQNIKK